MSKDAERNAELKQKMDIEDLAMKIQDFIAQRNQDIHENNQKYETKTEIQT